VLILIQKGLWGIVLLALAAGLFLIYGLHIIQPVQLLFAGELAEDPHDFLAHLLIGLLPGLAHRTALLLAIGALIYAALEAVEAWGLWRDVAWVEVLIVVETAGFLPYEGWELAHRVTPFKLASLVINLLILWYLIARYIHSRHASRRRHATA